MMHTQMGNKQINALYLNFDRTTGFKVNKMVSFQRYKNSTIFAMEFFSAILFLHLECF